MTLEDDPLVGPAPPEVHLTNAPLVRVIAQVRFSRVLAVQSSEQIAPVQQAIGSEYPVLHQEQAPSLRLGPEGIATAGPELVAWRFSSIDGGWRASLTPEFVALETTAYRSRADFIARMEALLGAVSGCLGPTVVQRIGLRYIGQVIGEPLNVLSSLIRQDLLGVTGTPMIRHLNNALSEAQMEAPEENAQLRLRWGHLAANATPDPNAIAPISEKSWILDFDMSRPLRHPFEVSSLTSDLECFAERLYAVFRWSVTNDFLEYFGGTP